MFEDLEKIFSKMMVAIIDRVFDYKFKEEEDLIKLLDPYGFYKVSNFYCRQGYLYLDLKPFILEIEKSKELLNCRSVIKDLKEFYNYIYEDERMGEKDFARLEFFTEALTPLQQDEKSFAKVMKEVESRFKASQTYGVEAVAYMKNFLEYSRIEFMPTFKKYLHIPNVTELRNACDIQRKQYAKATSNLAFFMSSECFLFELKDMWCRV